MRRGLGLFLPAAIMLALLTAPAAQATFHLIKVREVYPGSSDDSYIELQMFAAGQTFLTNRAMTVYDSTGTLVHSSKFAGGVTNGQNQGTVLIGDSGVQSQFGVAPDLVDSELAIPASGGAVCWNAGGLPADCVAWGNFSGGAALQTAAGTTVGSPASPGGVTAGKAIRRAIAPGCSTLLEESDDTNNSAGDFTEVTPGPRDNASPIVEMTCPGPPNTVIDERPPAVTAETTALFTYEAPTATSYECRLDAAPFSSCPSFGLEYTELAAGSHSFRVRGVNLAGPDPTPASYSWQVEGSPEPTPSSPPSSETAPAPSPASGGAGPAPLPTPVPALSIVFVKQPPARTRDRAPTFRFRSEVTASKFECALDREAFRGCRSPFTPRKPLSYGPHKLQIRILGASESTLRFRFRVVRGK
ncbi:MAG: hypothetical protein ACJ76D_02075 [Solirubrobacterales bacterium]